MLAACRLTQVGTQPPAGATSCRTAFRQPAPCVAPDAAGGGELSQDALAERLKALGEDGHLVVPDPVEAAEFLGLLVPGPVNNRSWYGAVKPDQADIDRLVHTGVRIFLRAYGN